MVGRCCWFQTDSWNGVAEAFVDVIGDRVLPAPADREPSARPVCSAAVREGERHHEAPVAAQGAAPWHSGLPVANAIWLCSPVMEVAHLAHAYGIDRRPLHGSEAVADPAMGARHLCARQTPEGQQLQERY